MAEGSAAVGKRALPPRALGAEGATPAQRAATRACAMPPRLTASSRASSASSAATSSEHASRKIWRSVSSLPGGLGGGPWAGDGQTRCVVVERGGAATISVRERERPFRLVNRRRCSLWLPQKRPLPESAQFFALGSSFLRTRWSAQTVMRPMPDLAQEYDRHEHRSSSLQA